MGVHRLPSHGEGMSPKRNSPVPATGSRNGLARFPDARMAAAIVQARQRSQPRARAPRSAVAGTWRAHPARSANGP
jgi:hypothetical protein